MAMDRESHEELLNTLLDPELEQSRRTEILQELRVSNNNALSLEEETSEKLSKLEADNSDLIISNSKLFRQIGIVESPESKEEEVKKDFSETVTIEELEKGE